MTDNDSSDENLFLAYRQHGDIAAFDALYQRYRQPLYRFLLRRGHSEANAEDLFHDCWMRVIDHHQHFDGDHFRAWLYRIARNLSIDAFRRASIRSADSFDEQLSEQQHPSAERQQQGVDCIELVKSSVSRLPLEQRDVFLLKEEAGLSLQQIAELMAVGRETIKSRMRYAMSQLRKQMADCL